LKLLPLLPQLQPLLAAETRGSGSSWEGRGLHFDACRHHHLHRSHTSRSSRYHRLSSLSSRKAFGRLGRARQR
jgi:hypothetical protein